MLLYDFELVQVEIGVSTDEVRVRAVQDALYCIATVRAVRDVVLREMADVSLVEHTVGTRVNQVVKYKINARYLKSSAQLGQTVPFPVPFDHKPVIACKNNVFPLFSNAFEPVLPG